MTSVGHNPEAMALRCRFDTPARAAAEVRVIVRDGPTPGDRVGGRIAIGVWSPLLTQGNPPA